MSNHIVPPERIEAAIRRLMAQGHYASVHDVIAEGIRLVEQRDHRLGSVDDAIGRAIADSEAGRVFPAEDVFAELKAMIAGGAKGSSGLPLPRKPDRIGDGSAKS